MSGLLSKYAILLVAAAMCGVTAFSVVPSGGSHVGSPGIISRETTAGESLRFVEPNEPFVAGNAIPHVGLIDKRSWRVATRLEVPSVQSVSLAFGGDILIHSNVRRAASVGEGLFDFAPMFDGIRPLIDQADLAICHLEVPLTSTNSGLSSYPRFNAPHEVATAVAGAGFDGCSTASNHSVDQGPAGLVDTLDILDRAGLAHSGTARTEEEAASATLYQVPGGPKVAHIAATYWLNGLQTPAGKDWMAQRIDVDQILDMAEAARWNGADLTVVSIHCCTEYRTEPTAEQVRIFERLIKNGWIDLVVGHHSHVVGPVERIGEEYVLYGLGNLLSGQLHRVGTREALIAVVKADWTDRGWRFVAVDALPTFIESGTYAVVPAPTDSDSYLRTLATLESRGVQIGRLAILDVTDTSD